MLEDVRLLEASDQEADSGGRVNGVEGEEGQDRQSHRLLFWIKGQHCGGGILKHLEGFVTPHEKHVVRDRFLLLSAPPTPEPGRASLFSALRCRGGIDKAHHSEARYSCPLSVGWTLPPLPSLLISGLSPCHHLLGTWCPADPPIEGPGEGPGDSIPEFSRHLRLPGSADVLGAMPTCCVSWPGWQSLGPH